MSTLPAADDDDDDDLPAGVRNLITPSGLAALCDERRRLWQDERPRIVEIVSWAAGNGDRSENGDYLYGKKRLREIDRRLRFLSRRIEKAEPVDPGRQTDRGRVFFGATVTYAAADGTLRTVTIVGADEIDPDCGRISWTSPVARALMRAEAGDCVPLRAPGGATTLEVITISYPET
jgi:transcription elongation factor GreB